MLDLPHPGWFAKFEIFRPGVVDGHALYLDLDTLVLGDLSDMLTYTGPLALLSDFYAPLKPQTGVMAWTAGDPTAAEIWDVWVEHAEWWMKREKSQARILAAIAGTRDFPRLQELFAGQILSYKKDARGMCPDGTRLLCGHGRPRFSQKEAGWAHDIWVGHANGVTSGR